MVDKARLRDNLDMVFDEILTACRRSERDPADVKLVAVTKTVDAETVQALYDLGVRDFGENRTHVGTPKAKELDFKDATWHFIGHLQRRQAKDIFPYFTSVHSLDRLKLAETLDRLAGENGVKLKCLLEVKTSEEDSKLGASEDEIFAIAEAAQAFENIKVTGLMTMAPYISAEETRPYFSHLRELRDKLETKIGKEYPELSMGMSNDFPIAVEEGATLVRVGSALFA